MKTTNKRIVSALLLVLIFQSFMPHAFASAKAIFSLQESSVLPLPDGKVGQIYEYQLQTEGGLAPLTWRVVAGEIPPGIQLDISGKLKGIPTTPRREAYSFVLEVADSSPTPQKFAQSFLLSIQAAPLRMVQGQGKLRFAPSTDTKTREKIEVVTDTSGQTKNSTENEIPYTPKARPASFRIPTPFLDNTSNLSTTASTSTVTDTSRTKEKKVEFAFSDPDKPKNNGSPFSKYEGFNPASFIRIFEDTKRGDRYLIYEPNRRDLSDVGSGPPKLGKIIARRYEYNLKNQVRTLPTQLAVDEDSTIVIEPIPEAMDSDLPLNQLFMRASLKKSDKTDNVEVRNYAEVGKDEAKMAAQKATAFQTTKNIQAALLNLYFTVSDLLHNVYDEAEENLDFNSKELKGIELSPNTKQIDYNSLFFKRLRDRVRFYNPEILAITNFLLDERNIKLVQIIGNDVFWIDAGSMQEISKQIQLDLAIAYDASLKEDESARNQALVRLLERAKNIYNDFKEARLDINRLERLDKMAYESKNPLPPDLPYSYGSRPERSETEQEFLKLLEERSEKQTKRKESVNEKDRMAIEQEMAGINHLIRQKAILIYTNMRAKLALDALKKYFVPGYVSLENADADDGNLLTLTIEAHSSNAESGGAVAEYQIAIKKFGAKLQLGSTMLFLNRKGVSIDDKSGLKPINYAPSPGMNFGVTFFKRGDHIFDKTLRAISPTIGVNVSFMNFNDPGYDLVKNAFTNTTGANVQIGAGPVVSLFNNKIDITTGWNLNADRKRRYFGIGFGFIEIAKFLKDKVKTN